MRSAGINGVLKTTSQFNALGQRVQRWVSGVRTYAYQFDESGHIIAENDANSGALLKEYVWLGDMPLAQIDSSGTIYYIHPDQLNTPQKMTDATGAVVWDRIQQPFGETYSITGTPVNNLRFPGQYYDADIALSYNYYRDYDQTLGRYIEADPIGMRGASIANVNLYGYVDESPINWTDFLGLDCEENEVQKELHNLERNLPGTKPDSIIHTPPPPAWGKSPANPTGMSGSPLIVRPGTNTPDTINDRYYTGHSFDQMQGRGFTPSVVENAITYGIPLPGNTPGTTLYYDTINNVSVVTNNTGSVITVRFGPP